MYSYSKVVLDSITSPARLNWHSDLFRHNHENKNKQRTDSQYLIQEYLWRAIDDALLPASAGDNRETGVGVIMDSSFLGLYEFAFNGDGRWIQGQILKAIKEIERDPSRSKHWRKVFNRRSDGGHYES